MTLFAKPGSDFVAALRDAPPGIAAELSAGIYLEPGDTVVSAFSGAAIAEAPNGATSDYFATRTAPAAAADPDHLYEVRWARDAQPVIAETLIVTATLDPLLARLRERVESDVSDDELSAILAEAQDAIAARYGEPGEEITVTLEGRRHTLNLARPAAAISAISEINWGRSAVDLDATDWSLENGGRTLRRLSTGTHPHWAWGWYSDSSDPQRGWGRSVTITYTTLDDSARRDEVTIKLAILALEYEGVTERKVGDTQTIKGARSWQPGQSPLVYSDERERLLRSLAPRPGLLFA
jgi:hypothetical protein